MSSKQKNQFIQLLIVIDQLLACVLGVLTVSFSGRVNYADETLSALAWRLKNQGWSWQYKLINKLFFWQSNHCESAYESEKLRRQLPAEYR